MFRGLNYELSWWNWHVMKILDKILLSDKATLTSLTSGQVQMKADLEHSFVGNISFLAQGTVHVGQSWGTQGPSAIQSIGIQKLGKEVEYGIAKVFYSKL